MIVLLLACGIPRVEAQVVPSNTPSITWAPGGAGTSNWFTAGNWNVGESTPRFPAATDNVGIGNGLPAPIVGSAGAVAQTVTLGQNTATYVPGSLTVTGPGSSLTITPLGTGTPGLQILQGSTLGILNGGIVTLSLAGSVVDNFGTINIGNGGLGGTINASTIQNEGVGVPAGTININLTNSTTLNANILGAGIITKEGTGTAIFHGGVAGARLTISGGTVVITNAGTLTAPVTVQGASSILQISGGTGTPRVTVENRATFDNAGILDYSNARAGIITLGPGVANVINRSTGNITASANGGEGLDFTGGGTVQNSGTISSNFTQSGASVGILVTGGQGTISNNGTISGGVELGAGGSVTNNTGGVIDGGNNQDGVLTPFPFQGGQPITIVNSGRITGINGANLESGGSITNNASGVIQGTNGDGIFGELPFSGVTGQGLTVVNSGTITGNTNGVAVDNGGSITNNAGGVIRGTGGDGILSALPFSGVTAGTVTVVNSGSISGSVNGVDLQNGGSITNSAGGTIQGSLTGGAGITNAPQAGAGAQAGAAALVFNPSALIIVNSGRIIGATGINLTAGGGSITNNAGGTITGVAGTAILVNGGSATISNAGTINGNISLGSGANTVQLISGGAVNGNLNLGTNSSSNLVLDGTTRQLLSQAVTGTITNPGSLTKQGSGNWIIDKMMDAPISTNVLAGILTVNSSLTSPLVTVQTGAMLKGAGNVIGNVTNFGTLSPGNSGTLTINGNYIQTSSGVYNVEIDSATSYSRLNVSGHATLDGTLRLTLASGYNPKTGTRFQVLTAGQGISGTFKNITSNQTVNVTYENGVVDVNAGRPVAKPKIHLSDGTPVSTTALIANNTFYGFGSLSQREALGLLPNGDLGRENAISVTFDAGEFDIQGNHGEVYGLPIAGGFKINDRARLNYEIPLQYVRVAGTSLFQAGLTLDLPMKVVIPSEDQPWSWDLTPTAAFATSGSKEILGGAALSNLVTYRWHGMAFTYGNYISFFEGSRLTTNDAQFPTGVDQQIMKNGFRVDIPFAKSWIFEAYGIHTNFFQTAQISSYFTVGFELGHHFIWNLEGQNVDLGYLSLGLYSEFGNHYSSGHAQIGSAWRF